MSHSIPVFFFPISDDEIPARLENWHSAEKLLSDKWDDREQNGLRTSTSRNWWHQHAINLICRHLQIDGLEFLQREIACLDRKQIQVSVSAIDKFLISCQRGIPELPLEMEKAGSIWFLRNYFEGNKVKKFSASQIEKAHTESCVVHEIIARADSGYDLLVEFFSFLKSVRAVLHECLSKNLKFLYVQPQP
jgi:hypothetical protein